MINELADKISKKTTDLERWRQDRLQSLFSESGITLPVYASTDLRNSGFKISVVDTNLFPSGFNNLCETFAENGSQAFKEYFQKWHPTVQKILIFPEEHTRNLYYWENISSLQNILHNAGFEVQIGSASTTFIQDPHIQTLQGGGTISVKKVFLRQNQLQTADFIPDTILINNDLSSGTPEYLKNLDQILLPSPAMGWHRRRKSDHFRYYNQLIVEVAGILEIDPWLSSPFTTVEKGVDLTDEICLQRLQQSADRLLSFIRQKYLQYGIHQEPYLFIKNNSGTYGLGITHIRSGSELLGLSRRARNKMEFAKGGQRVSEYLLQEGIPTADLYGGKPLEPVVYSVGDKTIGTFFRIHEEKNEYDSLNAPGMAFGCLCYHKVKPPQKNYQLTYEKKDQLFQVTSFLSRIASLAASLEFQEVVGRNSTGSFI